MKRTGSSLRERIAVAALLGLFVVAAGAALRADASAADEHPHILSGYLFWISGRFAGGLDNPPLGQLLVSLPLVLLDRPYRFPSDEFLWLCRLPVVLLGPLLGLVLWRWGRALGGVAVGVLAVAGLALEPNLLAHGHLATLDFPVTVLWWAVLWFGRTLILGGHRAGASAARTSVPVVALFALCAAAAVLVKFTGLLLFPALAIAAGIAATGSRARRAVAVALALSLVAAVLAAHAVYGFGPQRLGLPAALVESIGGKLHHRAEVHFAYLRGERSESGFLSYYLVALLVKTPLPLLLLSSWGGWRMARRRMGREMALLLVPAAVLLVVFTLARVHIGVRHVLPVFPALLLLSAFGAREAWRSARLRVVVLALGAAWLVGIARLAPQYLASFNVIAGGPAGGHLWLLDSNLDWGQDDGRLAAFLASPGGEAVAVDPDPMRPRTGRFAVSANALHNLQRRSSRPYSWLRNLRAEGFAGYSWRVYDLGSGDFERQVVDRPQDPAAAWGLSAVLDGRGDREGARATLEAAAGRLREPAARVELAILAARSAAERGSWQEARNWAVRGLGWDPDSPELGALARWFEFERALELSSPAASGSLALELGLYAADIGEGRAALAAIERAAALLPDDPEAQRALAVARARSGDFGAAVDLLGRPGLRERFGTEYALCRVLDEAQRAVDAGRTEVEPEVLLELARAHFEGERYDAAAAALVALLQQEPGHRLGLAYLCEMQVRSKMRIVEERLSPRLVRPDGSP